MHRRAILLLILLVVLVLFYASVAVDRAPHIISGQKAQTERLNRLDEQVLEAPAARPPGVGERAMREVFYGPPNSVAVLPFAVAGQDEEAAVAAEGLAGALADLLAGDSGLQVIARSSSFFFRDRGAGYPVIAERLQSRHILDGEWRPEGERPTLALSLFDARENRVVWRQEYADELAGLLGGLGGVCGDVVAELAVPPRAAAPPALPDPDPQAWSEYARGLYLADPARAPDLPGAAQAFEAALAIDPDFSAARVELAGIWLHPAWVDAASGGDPVSRARAAIRRVLEDDPSAARAWAVTSFIRHRYDWDWDGAVAAGRRAAELRPGDAGVLGVASLALTTVGDFEAAEEFLQDAVRRDPLNLRSRLRLGLLQEFRGEHDAALLVYRQILALNPEYPGAHAYRARVKVLQGKPEAAHEEAEQETDPFWRRYARILALTAQEEAPKAAPLLQEMAADSASVAAFQLAEIHAFSGDSTQAFEWLDRAYRQHDPGMASLLGNGLLASLRDEPRWAELLDRLGLPAPDESED